MKKLIWIIIILVLVLGGWYLYKAHDTDESSTASSTPTTTQVQTAANLPTIGSPATSDDIVVDLPKTGDVITSPLKVSGKARGSWFNEATAPVVIIDTNGTIVGRSTIRATGDWMTTNFVPFTGTISFATTTTSQAGAVVFMNDNPSGQASTSKYMILPVYFTP